MGRRLGRKYITPDHYPVIVDNLRALGAKCCLCSGHNERGLAIVNSIGVLRDVKCLKARASSASAGVRALLSPRQAGCRPGGCANSSGRSRQIENAAKLVCARPRDEASRAHHRALRRRRLAFSAPARTARPHFPRCVDAAAGAGLRRQRRKMAATTGAGERAAGPGRAAPRRGAAGGGAEPEGGRRRGEGCGEEEGRKGAAVGAGPRGAVPGRGAAGPGSSPSPSPQPRRGCEASRRRPGWVGRGRGLRPGVTRWRESRNAPRGSPAEPEAAPGRPRPAVSPSSGCGRNAAVSGWAAAAGGLGPRVPLPKGSGS